MSGDPSAGRARAFNLGCDARIAGEPLAANPCEGADREWWDSGWRHADSFWGVLSKRPVRRLPPVRK